jgi:hypothetical protein
MHRIPTLAGTFLWWVSHEVLDVVHRIYQESVPDKMSEAEFWTRYVKSRLHQQRTSAVANAAPAREDDMFDQCLKDEIDLLPSSDRLRVEEIHSTLNLAATAGDRLDEVHISVLLLKITRWTTWRKHLI